MAVLTTAAAFVRLDRSQWLDRPRLVELQATKLRRLIDHAYRTVPFYRAHFDRAGVRPGDIRTQADLHVLPPVTKDDLRCAEPEATLSTAFARESLSADRTSGSTAPPFTVMRTREFQAVRKAQVLRLLRTAGYRLGDRVLSLVRAKKPPPAWWSRWRYQSIDAPPEELLRTIDAFRPALITGYTTSLRQLARLIEEGGRISHRPRVLLNSGELLDDASRHLVSRAFRAPVLDAYAMTEMGVVAWECAPYSYHVSEDTLVIELEPVAGTGEARLILTNLELESMPFIRYASGDLVTVADSPEACVCGRKLLRLRRIDGRLLDTVLLPGGRMISPFRFTSLLQELPVRRYQLVQQDLNRFRLRLCPARPDEVLADRGRTLIRQIAGADAEVDVAWEDDLDPPPTIKFRAVESSVGRAASGV